MSLLYRDINLCMNTEQRFNFGLMLGVGYTIHLCENLTYPFVFADVVER